MNSGRSSNGDSSPKLSLNSVNSARGRRSRAAGLTQTGNFRGQLSFELVYIKKMVSLRVTHKTGAWGKSRVKTLAFESV